MMGPRLGWALLGLCVLAAPAQAARIIHAGSVIDGEADQASGPAPGVVDGDRLVEIVSGHRPP